MDSALLQMLSKAREVNLLIDGFTLAVNFSLPIPGISLGNTRDTATNIFTSQAGKWTLRFDGQETQLRDSIGLSHIHALLDHQAEFLAASTLVMKAQGEAVDCVSVAELQDAQDQCTSLSLDSQFKDEILPRRDRQWIIDRQEKLRGEMEASRANGEVERAEAALEDLEKIEQFLRKYRFGNHHAGFINQAERNRKSVKAAITRAILSIEKVHPTLARHLENSIETGSQCRYQPEKEVSWIL
jgi:hypothetical protein